MLPFPTELPSLTPLLAFGILLVTGALGGFFAHRVRFLPSITGFMLAGYVIGPGGLALLDTAALHQAKVVVDIALALILYRLGTSLDWRLLRMQPRLLWSSLLESTASFVAVFALLYMLGLAPLLSALIAAILVSSSPAVLLHVAHETGAKGPVTESAKILVGLNNLWSYAAFIALTPWLLQGQDVTGWQLLTQPMYLLLGSVVLGVVLGALLHEVCLRTQQAPQYQLALVIGCIVLALSLSRQLNVSTLLTPLLIGITVRSLEREHPVSNLNFGAAFELFFIVLFVYAGANLHLSELWQNAGVIVALVLLRTFMKWLSLFVWPVAAAQPWRARRAQGLMLMPMAGLAIGLVNASMTVAPQYAATVSALVLGAITLFETLGPPLVAWAFHHCGEAGQDKLQPQMPTSVPAAPNVSDAPRTLATSQLRWQGAPVKVAANQWSIPPLPTTGEDQAVNQSPPAHTKAAY